MEQTVGEQPATDSTADTNRSHGAVSRSADSGDEEVRVTNYDVSFVLVIKHKPSV